MIDNCKLIYAKLNNFKEEKILNVCVYAEQKTFQTKISSKNTKNFKIALTLLRFFLLVYSN